MFAFVCRGKLCEFKIGPTLVDVHHVEGRALVYSTAVHSLVVCRERGRNSKFCFGFLDRTVRGKLLGGVGGGGHYRVFSIKMLRGSSTS